MPVPKLFVLSAEESKASDAALCKFAQFLGVQTELVLLQEGEMPHATLLVAVAQNGNFLACASSALRKLLQQQWFANLLDRAPFFFVYGFRNSHPDWPELSWLTSGRIHSVSFLKEDGEKRITVSGDVTHGNFPVSGKSFTLDSGPAAVFSGAAMGDGMETYVSVNDRPNLVTIKRADSLIFILADEYLVDIDSPLAQYASIRGLYSQLVALSIVLRVSAGPWCWTSPVTGANFIVDDPDLTQRYGFFHHKSILLELAQARGALTVAFIPYNYRRSDPKTIALAQESSGRFSICVHGCDHTGGEYASDNIEWLTGLTFCARERMETHARRTGLPYDNVMVIPQGEFSIAGLKALKTCGFNAAVNTTPWPLFVEGTDPLTIRDLLQVAVTHYENFPLFVRRYPVDEFGYAFDALFQKPILCVEHHGYFRNGCSSMTDVVRKISGIKTNLKWLPLGRVIESSCLLRKTAEGQYTVRHFTQSLRLKNPTPDTWHLSFEKPNSDVSIKEVLINGREIDHEIVGGTLRYSYDLGGYQELTVRIVHHVTPNVAWAPSVKYRLSTWARRKLSDIRDNHIARSPWLLATAEKLKSALSR